MCSIKIKLDVVLRHKGMTLKELSEKTGLTISNLSNIKNNRIACIRFSTLEKLCKVLNCQPYDLLEYHH
ncbi:helix-turn-helix domain-containing protein [Bacteroides thetaiotaomicron]|uniref:helix-turn-helix domain-containing protein n=1 Tax=Bacteroides thetaiotaomicron TaxID=818 RepID=UPI0039B6B448